VNFETGGNIMSVAAEKLTMPRAVIHRSGELSYFSYIWKCVAGIEAAYFVCLLGAFGLERTAAGIQLHHTLFETLPGFTWLTPGSVILGAVYMFVFAVIIGAYMVWMHNSSINE
jgi:hypothetical protein